MIANIKLASSNKNLNANCEILLKLFVVSFAGLSSIGALSVSRRIHSSSLDPSVTNSGSRVTNSRSLGLFFLPPKYCFESIIKEWTIHFELNKVNLINSFKCL